MIRLLRARSTLGTLALCLLFLSAAASTRAADRARQRGEELLERIAVQFEALQSDPARRIPAEILREARGVAILHETRAGFVLGAKNGAGVVLVKDAQGWAAPAFYRTREGGIGLQAGWQRATFVQVLMTDAALQTLRTNSFHFGVGLRVTSGPRTVGDDAKTSSPGSDVLIYADTGGLYGGLSLEAGALNPDRRLNDAVYGAEAEAILFERRPAPTAGGQRLVRLLETNSLASGATGR